MDLILKILKESIGEPEGVSMDQLQAENRKKKEELESLNTDLCKKNPRGTQVEIYVKFLDKVLSGVITSNEVNTLGNNCQAITNIFVPRELVTKNQTYGSYEGVCEWNTKLQRWELIDIKFYGDNWKKIAGIRKS